MVRIEYLLCTALLLPMGIASATDKTSPDSLRNRHGGAATFSTSEDVKDLYPKLLQATQDCWAGEIKPGAGTGAAGGALGAMSSASRQVVGELSPDGASATIMVRAIGAFGALKNNFLQLDMKRENDGTHLEAFHRLKVKGQREFLVAVRHWLDGDLKYCKPDRFFNRESEGK